MKKDPYVYEACDQAIKAINRLLVEEFGRLKLSKWDEVNIVKTVIIVYRTTARKARKRYYEVAFEAYLIMLAMCGIPADEAHRMAEEAITKEWVDSILAENDPVMLFSFDNELERKAHRLAESIDVTENRLNEIDKAMKYWSLQLGQFAINVTDYAMIQAMQDAGVEECVWVARHDEKVCDECNQRDGKTFKLEDLPIKHINCRCMLKPKFKVLNSNAV